MDNPSEHRSLNDKLAIALTCLAAAMSLILYLAPKTRTTVGLMVASIAAFLVYPILHFVKSTARRVVIITITIVLVFLFGWIVWPTHSNIIGNPAHPLALVSPTVTSPRFSQPVHPRASVSQQQPPSASHPTKSHLAPAEASSTRTTVPPIGCISQRAGSALSFNQQGGITAGTINIDTHPHVVMNDVQRDGVTKAIKPFAGKHALILVNGATAEFVDFGNKLRDALVAAGVSTEIYSGTALSEGNDVQRPLFVGFKSTTIDMEHALVGAMTGNKILSRNQISYH